MFNCQGHRVNECLILSEAIKSLSKVFVPLHTFSSTDETPASSQDEVALFLPGPFSYNQNTLNVREATEGL